MTNRKTMMGKKTKYDIGSVYCVSGSEVRWYFYTNEQDARRASQQAIVDDERRRAMGFDSSFVVPGSIEYMDDGEYVGLWKVCVL